MDTVSDYIKREDATRQIVQTSVQNELDIPAIGTVLNVLSEMDSADVIEVVRCKDCKHSIQDKVMTRRYYCEVFEEYMMRENHYCSYGEKP